MIDYVRDNVRDNVCNNVRENIRCRVLPCVRPPHRMAITTVSVLHKVRPYSGGGCASSHPHGNSTSSVACD